MADRKNLTKRVLVVDGEKVMRDLLYDFLDDQGYKVLCAADGEEALKLYSQEHIDIVLLDLMMRPMDGMEILSAIITANPEASVIMITGYPSVESATEAIKKGAKDYITKPFNLDELELKLERVILERSLKGKLKKIQAGVWALLISIPFWLVLGIILAGLLKERG